MNTKLRKRLKIWMRIQRIEKIYYLEDVHIRHVVLFHLLFLDMNIRKLHLEIINEFKKEYHSLIKSFMPQTIAYLDYLQNNK